MERSTSFAATAAAALVFGAVQACGLSPESCIPGETAACACPGGQSGAQTCTAAGTFAACDCGASSGSAAGSSTPSDSSPTDPSGPTIVAAGTNVTALTAGEAVVFSAVVTDPDGNGDLAGGTLRSPDGGVQYGAFGVGAEKGAYSLTLSWTQMNQARPISFVGEEQRAFVAEFFDGAGHAATRTFTIRLHCDAGPKAACNGICLDVRTNSKNCGGCGHDCGAVAGANASDAKCSAGVCSFALSLPKPRSSTDTVSCEQSCAAYAQAGHRYQCAGGVRAVYACPSSNYGENCNCSATGRPDIGYVASGGTWDTAVDCATAVPTYIHCINTYGGGNWPLTLSTLKCTCEVASW